MPPAQGRWPAFRLLSLPHPVPRHWAPASQEPKLSQSLKAFSEPLPSSTCPPRKHCVHFYFLAFRVPPPRQAASHGWSFARARTSTWPSSAVASHWPRGAPGTESSLPSKPHPPLASPPSPWLLLCPPARLSPVPVPLLPGPFSPPAAQDSSGGPAEPTVTHPAPPLLEPNRISRSLPTRMPQRHRKQTRANGSRKPVFAFLHNLRKRCPPSSQLNRQSPGPPCALPPTPVSDQQALCSPTSRRFVPRGEASGNPRDCGERLGPDSGTCRGVDGEGRAWA